jgi:DNA repair protein RecN (Recombination protein N)
MLTFLHIRNFALIEQLELSFGPGLNILTGETGAGKSILIDALGIAIGERASPDSIRIGSDKLIVEAIFSVDCAQLQTRLRISENALENEDDPNILVMAREISRNGKSQCRINGRLVTVAILRAIGQDLVDIHGQHEHQSLLSADTHIDILDNWLGADVTKSRHVLGDKYDRLLGIKRELESLHAASRERARDLDLFRFQQSEIRDAALSADEVTGLTQERSRLTNSEKLHAVSNDAYHALNETALSSVNSTLSSLQRAAEVDESLNRSIQPLVEASAYLEESVSLLRQYRDTLDSEPGRLEIINERLDLIHSLQRKYGDSVAEIVAYLAEIELSLNKLEDGEVRQSELLRSQKSLENELQQLASDLSTRRIDGGKKFSAAIVRELLDLGMVHTRFEVSIQPQSISAKGIDRVEFLISTNPGEPMRPLARIASGGETSRLMLAIKSVLARTFQVPTIIFDEIDTGVGGRTGRVLADKLASLATVAQILCITHLPQIASRPASVHFLIEKKIVDGRTIVEVEPLSPNDREAEIARMLGGERSETVLLHAREMLAAT